MTARTVYVVTSGEYSDYTVKAVFERREDAEEHLPRIGDEIKEFVLFGPGDDPVTFRREVVSATLHVNKEGVITDAGFGRHRPYVHRLFALSDADALRMFAAEEPIVAPVNFPVLGWNVTVYANTEEQAVKAVRERAAKAASLVVLGLDPAEMEER